MMGTRDGTHGPWAASSFTDWKRNKYPAHLNFPFLDIAIDYFYSLK